DYVAEVGPLAPKEVREVAEQLCHALRAAHSMGIIHRDLKPANVFLSTAQRVGAAHVVKVLDFGVARIPAESLTLGPTPIGTPSWMSPEQVRGEAATTASDVWALGLLVFYMLTAKEFWRACNNGGGESAVMKEIHTQAVPICSMRALELGVPELVPRGLDP